MDQPQTPDAAHWFALVMGAASEIEQAANCLRDPDAKRVALSGAKHYRDKANEAWAVEKSRGAQPAPSTGNALEGSVGGVKFYGRRMFPMYANSPWVVQSIDARGEGPTHQAAVEAWYKDHEARHPNFAVGHIQYRPRDGEKHRPWAWHVYADGGKWLLADGSSYDAQFYPELAKVLGTVDGLIKLLYMSTATPVVEKDVLRANPTRDSLQP